MKFGQCGIRTLIRLLHLCAYCCFCYSFLHLVFFFTNNLKMILFFFFLWWNKRKRKGRFQKPSFKSDKWRAFGGWHSCLFRCNIIWTWACVVASRRTRLVVLTFCCYLYAAKRSIFPASKVLLRACVRMSLVLTFSCCQRARAGPVLRSRGGEGCFVPWAFLVKARTGSKAVNAHTNTHQYIYKHTHKHAVVFRSQLHFQ